MTPNAAYIALVSELFVLNTLRLIGIGAQAPMFIGLIIRVVAFEGDSKVTWFEGNYADYEADKHRRLGTDADQPQRIKYKKLTH